MRTLLSCVLLLLLAMPVLAGDVTGKWSGTIELKTPDGDRSVPVLLILKQSGQEITGSAGGGDDDQHPIKNGKADGDKLNFEVHQERDSGTRIYKLALSVVGSDKLEGTILREDQPEVTGKLTAAKKAD